MTQSYRTKCYVAPRTETTVKTASTFGDFQSSLSLGLGRGLPIVFNSSHISVTLWT